VCVEQEPPRHLSRLLGITRKTTRENSVSTEARLPVDKGSSRSWKMGPSVRTWRYRWMFLFLQWAR
jgi:hypothetical protein